MSNSNSVIKFNWIFLLFGVPLFLYCIVLDINTLKLLWQSALAEKAELNRGRQALPIDPVTSRDGDIVIVAGELIGGDIVDPLTGFSFKTPMLRRELHRWVEVEQKSGTGDSAKTSYVRKWAYQSHEVYKSAFQINGYEVDKGLVEKGLYKPLRIDRLEITDALPNDYRGKILALKGNVAYLKHDVQQERKIGDIRFIYFYIPPVTISVVGIFRDNKIEQLHTPTGPLRAEGYADVDSIINDHVFRLGWILFGVTFYFIVVLAIKPFFFYALLMVTSDDNIVFRYWVFFPIIAFAILYLSRFGTSVEQIERIMRAGIVEFFLDSIVSIIFSFFVVVFAFVYGARRK